MELPAYDRFSSSIAKVVTSNAIGIDLDLSVTGTEALVAHGIGSGNLPACKEEVAVQRSSSHRRGTFWVTP